MLSNFMAVCLGRDWSTQHCSGKHPRHPKYLSQREISHEIVEKKYSILMTNSVLATGVVTLLSTLLGSTCIGHCQSSRHPSTCFCICMACEKISYLEF